MNGVVIESPPAALRCLILVGALACLFCGFASADDFDREVSFEIAPQSLATAILRFAEQSKIQVVTASAELEPFRTNGLTGRHSVRAALNKLLIGTGLTFREVGDGTVSIGRGTRGEVPVKPPVSQSNATAESLQLAQAVSGAVEPSASEGRASGSSEHDAATVLRETPDGIPEMLVEGSRILNVDIQRTRDDPQPYVVFDRQRIELSGATSLEDFLKQRLPMNTVAQLPAQGESNNGAMSQINLRGLSAGETLILVDGHRTVSPVSPSGPLQSDLNGIPLAAVERIEVLPTTASGIYGGGATGGVVNIVLRRDYAGLESKLTYDDTFEGSSAVRRIDMAGGFDLEDGRTAVMFAASWSDAEELLVGERKLVQRGRAQIFRNNPSFFTATTALPPFGGTPNVRSLNGSPLFGAGTPHFASVPAGYAGGGGLAPLQANSGQYNLDLAPNATAGGAKSGLLNAPSRESLTMTLRRRFTPRVETFLELAGFNSTSHFPSNFATGAFIVSASAPNNPFGQDILVRVPQSQGLDGEVSVENEERRAVGGVIVQMPADWSAAADFNWNRATFSRIQPDVPTAALRAAVANGTLDVLRDTSIHPLDFSTAGYLGPIETSEFPATLKNTTLRLAGPLGSLPAGAPTLGLTAEHRDEFFGEGRMPSLSNPTLTQFFPDRSQSVESAYLEFNVPFFSSRNRRPGLHDLKLQLAGRWDRYAVDGATSSVNLSPSGDVPPGSIVRVRNTRSSTNPTAGVSYSPLSDLMLRASYGTGFLPPSVQQLVRNSLTSTTNGGNDPRRGGTPTGVVTSTGGGNPDLLPEESESWSAGMILTPRWAPGLRLSIDYTRIEKTNNIATLTNQMILDNENLFPERVIRGPVPPNDPYGVGPVIELDRTLANIARTDIEAWDVQADYSFELGGRLGTLELFALATWQPHFETQIAPTTAVVENAGVTSQFPLEIRANGGLAWNASNWTLSWNARYFDSYELTSAAQILSQGTATIPSQIYHDVFGAYRLGAGRLPAPLSGAELQFGVRNVFDTEPPVDVSNSNNLYSSFADPRLRSYYLSLKAVF